MSKSQQRFTGGTAVITGAGAGIGEGLARYAASIKMRVIVADIDAVRAQAVASDLVDQGGRAEAQPLDVTDPDAVDRLAEDTFNRYGSVELLINNAGLETGGVLWDIPVSRWRQLMTVNLNGMFYGIRSFVPRMIEAAKPAVVANVSSVGGVMTAALQTPYIVSKHAVLALTECLHQEVALAQAPIQVSVILPYSVRSRIFMDAQQAAPSGSSAADHVFEEMQKANVAAGMDPLEAAGQIFSGLTAGDFWIFTDDVVGHGALTGRARTLAERLAPPPPYVF